MTVFASYTMKSDAVDYMHTRDVIITLTSQGFSDRRRYLPSRGSLANLLPFSYEIRERQTIVSNTVEVVI